MKISETFDSAKCCQSWTLVGWGAGAGITETDPVEDAGTMYDQKPVLP